MKKVLIVLSLGVLTLLTSCSEKKETSTTSEFNFKTVEDVIKTYDLDKSISFIKKQNRLPKKDSLKLVKYTSFLTTLKDISNKLQNNDKASFIKQVIDFQKGIYDSKVLYADSPNYPIYEGNTFVNANLILVNSNFWQQTPQDLAFSFSYDDKYYNHIFTDFDIITENKTIKLNKKKPANGFKDEVLKGRPFKVKLTDKQIEAILSPKSKIVLTTTQTYNDRAYLNGTIWDIKSGEAIKYNDISVFKERKAQVLKKGEIKKFEIPVNDKFRDRLKSLYNIHKILERNNIK